MLGAEERMVAIEFELFQSVRTGSKEGKRIQQTAEIVAHLDVLNRLPMWLIAAICPARDGR
ncbi:MAG: hypothetical protein R2864_04775 [Syntrophotaleaceae bacterium]